ncbi:MAG: GSCFA domain-containing protein [Bacteroidia bacterium]|nr:GSCFA domain-containing protein [Bacteroidia bacterium]
MNFHLQFTIPAFQQKLSYEQKSMLMGSCFAENIGEKMQEHKFNCLINPHGVLYNPTSIAQALTRYLNDASLKEEELFYAHEQWNSWEHHSRYSDADKVQCIAKINQEISAAHTYLKEAQWLFITFGSSFVYKRKDTGNYVGNCHKVPASQFEKELLTTEAIVQEYSELILQLKKFNPNLKIVFTVSPVRYIRDGVVENNRSKANLITAVHDLVDAFEHVFYFPAYEIVIDELRDYRFYKEDLVHPNEIAINYVYEKLAEVLLDEFTKKQQEKILELLNAMRHKPFNEQSEAHRKFKANYLARCKEIQKELPVIDLKKEEAYFT